MESLSTNEWQAIDSAHHMAPFTDYADLRKKGARIITRAEGHCVYDSDGNRILDGMAGLWCVNVGYGRRELVEAASSQMAELPYYNNFFKTSNPPVAALSKRLAELTPDGLNNAFFANSGSEANDTIIRMVRHFWALEGKPEKRVIIGREYGYHVSTNLDDTIFQPGRGIGRKNSLILIALIQKAVRWPDMFEIRLVRRLVMHGGHATHAGRHDRAAVIPIGAPDDDAFFRLALKRPEMPHHANDGVIRLRPGIGIEHIVQPIRRQVGKLLRQRHNRLIAGLEEVVVIGKRMHLCGGGLDKFRPAIADIHTPQSRHPIKDAVAVCIEDVMAFGMGDDARALLANFTIIGKGRHMVRRIKRLPVACGFVVECHVGTVISLLVRDQTALS